MELRDLPSVAQLSSELQVDGWVRVLTTDVARRAIDESRRRIQEGMTADPSDLARVELSRLQLLRPTRVITRTWAGLPFTPKLLPPLHWLTLPTGTSNSTSRPVAGAGGAVTSASCCGI